MVKLCRGEINNDASRDELLSLLHALDGRYSAILDTIDIVITLVDADTLERVDGNRYFAKVLGYTHEEFHDIGIKGILVNTDSDELKDVQEETLRVGVAIYTTQYRKKDGSILDFLMSSKLVHIKGKDFILNEGRDITELLTTQRERDKAYDDLELKVQDRTLELSLKTETLEREIIKRKAVEDELRQSQEALSQNNRSLEEMNTALKILLKKRDEEKSEVEENFVSNVKELIAPYLEQFKKTTLTSNQRSLLSVVELNLKEVVAPYLHRMFNNKYTVFTPREIQIANLVKIGKSTKEIAEILSTGTSTVEEHRKHIRKKLGLSSKGVNLRSYLLSKQRFPE